MSGAASGALAAFVTQPFDVVKTRVEVSDRTVSRASGAAGAAASAAAPPPQAGPQLGSSIHSMRPSASVGGGSRGGVGRGVLPQLVQIAHVEGFTALFSGLGPRLAKIAPSCAIMIASFEMGKRFFRERARHSPCPSLDSRLAATPTATCHHRPP